MKICSCCLHKITDGKEMPLGGQPPQWIHYDCNRFVETRVALASLSNGFDQRMLGRYDVTQLLRQHGRDYLRKPDDYSDGFYKAIKVAEKYFQLNDGNPEQPKGVYDRLD